MADLRLVEHYTSTQGEGPRTGRTTQFVRFAGCNMTCAGWPCDTPFAVDPKIWGAEGGSYKRTPEELLKDCKTHRETTGANNICLTGGEPFLQPMSKMDELILLLVGEGFEVEAFSNGSFLYSDIALKNVTFMMDWKLGGSGEAETRRENRTMNAANLRSGSGIKFVCKDKIDFEEALETHDFLKGQIREGVRFWAGSAWDVFPTKDLVGMMLEHKVPWSLNVQVHNYIWPANERGR